MDIYSPDKRSAVMQRIRSVDTKPEVNLRKALFARGFRYRKNVSSLPGRPDIVLAKHKYIIQVRGCFWHSHENCPRAHKPISNTGYWLPKLARTRRRDAQSDQALAALGWRLRIVWECEISSKSDLELIAGEIAAELSFKRVSMVRG